MLAAFYTMTIFPALYIGFMLSSDAGLAGITISQYFVAALLFYLAMGMHYGTSAAIFMGLTNPAIAATRNLTISYTNAWQGAAVDAWDYSTMFYIDAGLAIIPILVIPFLAERLTKEIPLSKGAPLPEAG